LAAPTLGVHHKHHLPLLCENGNDTPLGYKTQAGWDKCLWMFKMPDLILFELHLLWPSRHLQ